MAETLVMQQDPERRGENHREEIAEIEAFIQQLEGVRSARVVATETGAIEEVHVLAGADRNPKQIVRDIESVLRVRWGKTIDHKRISVAQMREPGKESCQTSEGFLRLRLQNLSVRTLGREVEVSLELVADERHGWGEARGPAAALHVLRLAAQATLAAVVDCLETEQEYFLEDVSTTQHGRREVVLVSVAMVNAFEEKCLLGACFVQHDPAEAAARATLNAINRCLEREIGAY